MIISQLDTSFAGLFRSNCAAIIEERRPLGKILRVDKFDDCGQPDGVANFRAQTPPQRFLVH